MTAKIIPIIDSPMEAADQAVRDDVYAALRETVNAIDAKIAALEHKFGMKIEELVAKLEREGGQHPS